MERKHRSATGPLRAAGINTLFFIFITAALGWPGRPQCDRAVHNSYSVSRLVGIVSQATDGVRLQFRWQCLLGLGAQFGQAPCAVGQ
jgi:hypothetical protein